MQVQEIVALATVNAANVIRCKSGKEFSSETRVLATPVGELQLFIWANERIKEVEVSLEGRVVFLEKSYPGWQKSDAVKALEEAFLIAPASEPAPRVLILQGTPTSKEALGDSLCLTLESARVDMLPISPEVAEFLGISYNPTQRGIVQKFVGFAVWEYGFDDTGWPIGAVRVYPAVD